MSSEAGDPRCRSAGRRRPIVCQCLLPPLYAARQCYKNGRCGGRRGCLGPELWIRRLSLTSDSFLPFVMPFVLRNELSAVERHSPVIPTAVEGSLLLRTSAAANFNSLSGFFDSDRKSNPSHPRKDAKGGPARRGSCRRTSRACSISLIEAELRPAQAGRRAHLGYLLSAENQMHSGRASLGPGRPPATG